MNPTEHSRWSRLEDYEERWERAGARDAKRQESPGREPASVVGNLEGSWKVERLSGLLPMPFVWKRIRGGRGETYVLPPSLPAYGLPFELEQREGYVALLYRPPLSFLVDELRLEADGTWLGRANVAGIRYAWFRLVPMRNS